MQYRDTIAAEMAQLRPEDRYALSLAAYDKFATLVEGLSADEWGRPTDCTAWSVRDLVGHMVGAMRSAASKSEFESQTKEVGERHRVEGGNRTDVLTAVQVERTAGMTTWEITAQCRALVEPAAQGRRDTPEVMLRTMQFPVDIGPAVETWTLGYLFEVILTRDAWMHAADLARAVGAPFEVTPELDGRIVADVVGEWALRHGQDFDLTLSGPAGGHWSRGAGPSLELDAVEFCRILSGRGPRSGLLETVVPF